MPAIGAGSGPAHPVAGGGVTWRMIGFALAALALAGCGQFEQINGSGTLKTETRPVQGFTAIELSGVGDVVVEQTGTEFLAITTDDNLLPLVVTAVKSGTLEIGPAPSKSIAPTKLQIKITTAGLRKVDVSGSGRIEATKLTGADLSADISGSGSVKLAGQVDNLKISISGSGSFDGADLIAKRARASVSGSGRVRANVTEDLDAEVSGSGRIEYLGNPKVKSDVSGSGSIRPAGR